MQKINAELDFAFAIDEPEIIVLFDDFFAVVYVDHAGH